MSFECDGPALSGPGRRENSLLIHSYLSKWVRIWNPMEG
jgi:hypothetical protein